MTHQMSTVADVAEVATPASLWRAVAGGEISDELLEWPPDLFALTDVLLERSEVYRFAFCPPGGLKWPPDRCPFWPAAVADEGRLWSGWVEDETESVPDLLAEEWGVFREGAAMQLSDLTEARDWRMCEALLTLHAIADEACAGLGVPLTTAAGTGCVYRARGRELLARTGSLSRIPSHLFRVLPKVRTSVSGSSVHSLSRYACVHRPGVEARWHNVPGRRPGTEPRAQAANMLLLPWPLRVRASDFRPIDGSVHTVTDQPFGLFEFAPSEGLDFDLVDRMLVAAEDEVDAVDMVCLPESAVEETELEDLEALLGSHGVVALITGVRQRPQPPGQLPSNWVHQGVSIGDQWVHVRQNKHHRWSLDEGQIYQYHLGGALHPHVRWWEAIEVPRRAVEFVAVGEGVTVVGLVCEDLAQIDDVSELLRLVGPTLVVTPLLDGPQLSSRWAARYASVLADNPGSAVLTLTAYGMARRSRPGGRDACPVIALWKDPAGGTREIPLESGAQGVLLSASADMTTRHSRDGRSPVENCTQFFDVGVCQVRASRSGSTSPKPGTATSTPLLLEGDELTILTSWAEAVAEALAAAPDRVEAVLADPQAAAPWRTALGITEPSPQLSQAIDAMRKEVRAAEAAGRDPTIDAALLTIREGQPGERGLDRLARRVLRYALEQRITRRGKQAVRHELPR
jgi:hypothetical protein